MDFRFNRPAPRGELWILGLIGQPQGRIMDSRSNSPPDGPLGHPLAPGCVALFLIVSCMILGFQFCFLEPTCKQKERREKKKEIDKREERTEKKTETTEQREERTTARGKREEKEEKREVRRERREKREEKTEKREERSEKR